MTPRSRKPVMLAIFGTDAKSSNISQLLEESGEMLAECEEEAVAQSSGDIPLNNLLLSKLRSKSESDISSANDNGLPVVMEPISSQGSNSAPESLTNAFKDYLNSRGNMVCDPNQDDDSFSSQPDDFNESLTEYQKLDESKDASAGSSEKDIEMDEILNQSTMSETLLYVLDGNDVSSQSPLKMNRKRRIDTSSSSDLSSSQEKRPLIESNSIDL